LNTPGSTTANRLVSEIGERGLIERIRQRLPAPPPELLVGPGDDAAVVQPERGALQILTTDAVVEGVHFDLRFSTPADVGYKALAVNVSDVAAMGGTPRLALLSLMLPDAFTVENVDHLLDGFLELGMASRLTLAGGNITRSPGPLIVDVTVAGSARPRKLLTRKGGGAGDALYVSGAIGAAAAGLGWLRVHGRTGTERPADPVLAECVDRHRRPSPRARLGALLGRTKAASACMDLSDGLADAVRQVAEASGTGACIHAFRLPVHPGALQWFSGAGMDPVEASVRGGDDYELLFAVPPRRKGRLRNVQRLLGNLGVAFIGELTDDASIALVRDGVASELPSGFVHF
jgi:thiamine-monophosphate kinase